MICIIAMVVLGILSIFSAKYRPYAKESFRCVFRTVQLKPCDTNFDNKIKSKMVAKLMKRSPGSAKFVYNNFRVLSLIMVAIFFVSLGYTFYSLYNLATTGSCDPSHPESCPLSGLVGQQKSCDFNHCNINGCTCNDINCTSPDFIACNGNCTCIKGLCNGMSKG